MITGKNSPLGKDPDAQPYEFMREHEWEEIAEHFFPALFFDCKENHIAGDCPLCGLECSEVNP